MLTQTQVVRTGIALGVLYGIYKFAPHQALKAMALGAAGTVIAKQVPYVRDALI